MGTETQSVVSPLIAKDMTMNEKLFQGKLVRIAAQDPEKDVEAFVNWSRDSEFHRLLDFDPVRPYTLKSVKEQMEKDATSTERFLFSIRTLADDCLIGFMGLYHPSWNHGDVNVGIGIGEREYWGKGYGTDAMRVMLDFAFMELNLHRISLMVLATNTRAIRSYEKTGFVLEGRIRQSDNRDGSRDDIVAMGILRREWEKLNADQ
jgi:RimJ/RimL family protein N-acetyltransferase